jgi:hypothetical protein
MIGCGVKGYTAMMASALVLRIMATSVLNNRDLINLPRITIPLLSLIASGTRIMLLRRFPLNSGMYAGLAGLSISKIHCSLVDRGEHLPD